jgi:hypothetical protein
MPITDDINSMTNLFSDTKIDYTSILDLWTSWQLTTEIKDKLLGYTEVRLTDGLSWHTISDQAYGRRDFWWVICLYNEIEDPFSIFYGDSINEKTTTIKIPEIGTVNFIIGTIRSERLKRETQ